jgi:2-(1,2-epoxy-1,2-dihydrophenyl)acetyl-CoA isomerase
LVTAMSYRTIEFRTDKNIAVLYFNRPDQLNSFNNEMHAEIRDALTTKIDFGVHRCLLLSGKGRAFCAGQDLNERKFDADNPPDLGESLENNYNPLINIITSLELPVVCAVNGLAAGAGVGIALACDIVLASSTAEFIFSFAKVGLGLDSASSWSLPRLIGLPRARAMTMLGERLTAERAEEWGMIWKCYNDEKLMDEALSMAHYLSQQPTRGLAIIKQELKASTSNTLEQQLALEVKLQKIAGVTEDYREGVLAFFEKRKPVFKGK